MRLLLTRPREDAENFANLLRARGHEPIVAPLMAVNFHEGPNLGLEGVGAVLATSANGVRALSRRTARRDIELFAVGPQTAKTAREMGFSNATDAGGDSHALTEIIAKRVEPGRGALFHARGAEIAGEIAKDLAAMGFKVISEVLYEAVPLKTLPAAAGDALREGTLDGVLLFSPRSARIFASLTAEAGLAAKCASMTAFCISAATASALAPLKFMRVEIAAGANQDAMLALLKPI